MTSATPTAMKSPDQYATYTEGLTAGLVMFFREFCAAAFSPYRPEKHYMRGPGPAWRAKHGQ